MAVLAVTNILPGPPASAATSSPSWSRSCCSPSCTGRSASIRRYERRGPLRPDRRPGSSAPTWSTRWCAGSGSRWPRAGSRSRIFLRGRRGADAAARHLHGARVPQRARVPHARARRRVERLTYRVMRRRPRPRAGLEGLRAHADRLLGPLLARALPDPAHADDPSVQPAGLQLGPVGRELQHRLVVRHEHELAVLRRRDHAERTSARWPG